MVPEKRDSERRAGVAETGALFWCVRRVLFVPQKNGKKKTGVIAIYVPEPIHLDLLSIYSDDD